MAREPSRTPNAIRTRLRKDGNERDAAMLAAELYKPLEEWDLEELGRGRPRDADGRFVPGGKPKWITAAVKAEINRRLPQEALAKMGEHVALAIAVIYQTMMSPDVDQRTRMDAAKYLIDHVVGKARQYVDVTSGGEGFQAIIASAMKVMTENGDYVDAHPIHKPGDE